jgi:hypothetical protein
MKSLKVKLAATAALAVIGYFIIKRAPDFILPVYYQPAILLSMTSIFGLLITLFVISLWIYAVIRMSRILYVHARYGSDNTQKLKRLERESKDLDTFMDVAQKEFMKRKISKDTFNDIQKASGKKLVEIKAKKKEILGEGKK